MISEGISRYRRLRDICADSFESGGGITPNEATMFEILGLLQSDDEAAAEFIQEARGVLFSPDPGLGACGSPPLELIELAAHHLQWEELRVLAEMANSDPASTITGKRASARVIEAFSLDWPDREYYARYF